LAKAKEFETVTKQRDEQKAKYEDLRKQRLDEFMAGFNMISSKLKEMYQVSSDDNRLVRKNLTIVHR
jgi:structural maintenance of chromosome 4